MNEAEARSRYEVIHLREQAARRSAPLDPAQERAGLGRALANVVGAWTRVAHRSAQPCRCCWSRKYLAGEISLGTMMQVSMAFVQVQAALNWFVANYVQLSEWYTSVVRVVALQAALDDLSNCPGEPGLVPPPRNPSAARNPPVSAGNAHGITTVVDQRGRYADSQRR